DAESHRRLHGQGKIAGSLSSTSGLAAPPAKHEPAHRHRMNGCTALENNAVTISIGAPPPTLYKDAAMSDVITPNPYAAPASDLQQSPTGQVPSIEEALARGYDFSIGELLSESGSK